MGQHEKLIKITPDCWHYRLIKYVWNINPKMFMNLCPYFWLTIASIVLVPFVWVCRQIVKYLKKLYVWVEKYLDKISDKELENYVKTLNTAQIIEVSENGYCYDDRLTCDVRIPKSLIKKYSYYYIIYKWLELNKMTEESLTQYKGQWEEFKRRKIDERDVKEKQKRIKEKKKEEKLDKLKKDREKINKAIRNTKYITGVIITALLAFAFFYVVKMFVYLFVLLTEFILFDLMATITVLGVTLGIVLLCIIIALYCKRVEGIVDRIINWQHASIKEWIITAPALIVLGTLYVICYCILYTFLWKWIIYAAYKGLKDALFTFTGIFGEYFGASYSDYCPGIEWDENDGVKN